MGPGERTRALLDAAGDMAGQADTFEGHKLTITVGPGPVAGAGGEMIGVEVWVSLRGPDGLIPIDPHRVIVNPPLLAPVAPRARDADGRTTGAPETQQEPVQAFWAALWASVVTHPSPETAADRKVVGG